MDGAAGAGQRHGADVGVTADGATDDQLGQAAYEAYCGATDGRSAVTGDLLPSWAVLPSWAEQSEAIRLAWIAAARAAARRALPGSGF